MKSILLALVLTTSACGAATMSDVGHAHMLDQCEELAHDVFEKGATAAEAMRAYDDCIAKRKALP